MAKKKNRILAGVLGGMAGGAAMALGLYATSKIDLSRLPVLRNFSDETDQLTFVGTSHDSDENGAGLGKAILISTALGGLYGGLRSAMHLPRFMFGPVFGIASYGLGRIGMGPEVSMTPGPWNNRAAGILPSLVTNSVFGLVTDLVSERMEQSLG